MIYSVFLKGFSIVLNLLLIPAILTLLDVENYGIWLTVSSIVTWFSFFDVGLANGLRNKLANALADGDIKKARIFISTTYAILFGLFIIIGLGFFLLSFSIDWNAALNTQSVEGASLMVMVNILIIFFLFNNSLKIIGTIALADQRPAINNLIMPVANVISLIMIYVLLFLQGSGSLVQMALIMSLSELIVLIVLSSMLFSRTYRDLRPSLYLVRLNRVSDLLTLGLKFFFIQAASIIFYSSTNVLIIHNLSASSVSQYSIAFKYFSIPVMVYSAFLIPVWSATTNAYRQDDMTWIKHVLKRLNMLSMGFVLLTLILLSVSSLAFDFLARDKLTIPVQLSIYLSIYSAYRILLMPYIQMINGLGHLRLSVWITGIKMLYFFPLMIFCMRTFGLNGVAIGLILNSITGVIILIQVKKILSGSARGIWIK